MWTTYIVFLKYFQQKILGSIIRWMFWLHKQMTMIIQAVTRLIVDCLDVIYSHMLYRWNYFSTVNPGNRTIQQGTLILTKIFLIFIIPFIHFLAHMFHSRNISFLLTGSSKSLLKEQKKFFI